MSTFETRITDQGRYPNRRLIALKSNLRAAIDQANTDCADTDRKFYAERLRLVTMEQSRRLDRAGLALLDESETTP